MLLTYAIESLKVEAAELRDCVKLYLKRGDAVSLSSEAMEETKSQDDMIENEELVVDVDLPSQRTVELKLRKGDNISKVVEHFCKQHQISDAIRKHLESYVMSQLNLTVTEAGKTDSPHQVQGLAQSPPKSKFDASPRSRRPVSTLQKNVNKQRAESQIPVGKTQAIDRRLSRLRRWTEGQSQN